MKYKKQGWRRTETETQGENKRGEKETSEEKMYTDLGYDPMSDFLYTSCECYTTHTKEPKFRVYFKPAYSKYSKTSVTHTRRNVKKTPF